MSHATFSFDQLRAVATEGYAREANTLANACASRYFPSLMSRLGNYPQFLREERAKVYGDIAARLCGPDRMDRLLSVVGAPDFLTELFACAHLSSSCYMFNGLSIPVDQLNHPGLHAKANELVERVLRDSPKNIRTLLHNLHNMDAIRTTQMLKLAGLLNVEHASCRQLSLGAGHGSRDLAAIHQVPVLNASIPPAPGRSGSIDFHSYCLSPRDVILSDNDPGLKEYFDELNANPESGIRAIPEDTYEALEKVPAMLTANKLGLRNLVLVFRIDHRMLPDLPAFFRLLSAVVVDGADFVLSIGAGHDLDEFHGRLEKIDEISHFLNEKGIVTTRFRLYSGDSTEQKRNSCGFGAMPYATYELLHCRLNTAALSK